MKLLVPFLFTAFFMFSQERKGSLTFDISPTLGLIDIVSKPNNDIFFNRYFASSEHMGGLKVGIGWRSYKGLTFSLKTSFYGYNWNKFTYLRAVEKTYTNTYVYPKDNTDNFLGLGCLEVIIGGEVGYLMKFEKITLKPNLELSLLFGKLSEVNYGYRSNMENLINTVDMSPVLKPSLYFEPSIDIGIPKWKRAFFRFGYGYSQMNVGVETITILSNGFRTESTRINKFNGHKIMIGFKFALL